MKKTKNINTELRMCSVYSSRSIIVDGVYNHVMFVIEKVCNIHFLTFDSIKNQNDRIGGSRLSSFGDGEESEWSELYDITVVRILNASNKISHFKPTILYKSSCYTGIRVVIKKR